MSTTLNLAVVCGRLSRASEEVPLASGEVLVRYEVTVPRPDDKADTLPVVAISPPAIARGLDAAAASGPPAAPRGPRSRCSRPPWSPPVARSRQPGPWTGCSLR
jgi:hypothetical protein